MTAATANRKFKSLANTVEIASEQLLNKLTLLNDDVITGSATELVPSGKVGAVKV